MTKPTSPRGSTAGFPEPLVDFVDMFNRAEFWESHEVLEGAWRDSRSGFYHGLILYASAFVHVQRRNPRGVKAQLRKAEAALQPYTPGYLGVDVEGILREVRSLRHQVEEAGPMEWAEDFVFPKIHFDHGLLRGNEVEIRAS